MALKVLILISAKSAEKVLKVGEWKFYRLSRHQLKVSKVDFLSRVRFYSMMTSLNVDDGPLKRKRRRKKRRCNDGGCR